MKRFKLVIWILILFIIEIAVINRIRFFTSAPDIVFAFAVVYAMLEEDYNYAIGVSVICGICTGSVCSGSFPVSVLMYSYSALLVRALRNKPRYIPDFVKTLFWIFVLSAAGETVLYFVLNLSFGLRALWEIVLPFSVFNLIAAAVMYPIVKKTMTSVDEKKKLIPD